MDGFKGCNAGFSNTRGALGLQELLFFELAFLFFYFIFFGGGGGGHPSISCVCVCVSCFFFFLGGAAGEAWIPMGNNSIPIPFFGGGST